MSHFKRLLHHQYFAKLEYFTEQQLDLSLLLCSEKLLRSGAISAEAAPHHFGISLLIVTEIVEVALVIELVPMVVARGFIVSTRSREQISHELRHVVEERADGVIGGFTLVDKVVSIVLISGRLCTDLLFDLR